MLESSGKPLTSLMSLKEATGLAPLLHLHNSSVAVTWHRYTIRQIVVRVIGRESANQENCLPKRKLFRITHFLNRTINSARNNVGFLITSRGCIYDSFFKMIHNRCGLADVMMAGLWESYYFGLQTSLFLSANSARY